MYNLTSLTLVEFDLTLFGFQPQSTLQVLTLRDVSMRSCQLEQWCKTTPS